MAVVPLEPAWACQETGLQASHEQCWCPEMVNSHVMQNETINVGRKALFWVAGGCFCALASAVSREVAARALL